MLSIVIPVYNEQENIGRLFMQIRDNIKVAFELIIVYDSDQDNTLPVIRELNKDLPFTIKMVKNKFGRGALNAIKTGLMENSSEAVLVMMADLSDDLQIVDKMYEQIMGGDHLVCGSRYIRGGRQIGGPLLKKCLSRIAGQSLHFLIGIPTHDITNSFKMYSRQVLESIRIQSNGGFEIGMEITIKAYLGGFKIAEIPSTWLDRNGGESRFKMWTWIPKYLKWYFYGVYNYWLNNKVPPNSSNKVKGGVRRG